MSVKERVTASLLAVILFFIFFAATRTNFYTMGLDAAFTAEMIDTTFQYGVPLTRLGRSFVVALETLIEKPAEWVCVLPLGRESPEFLNIFDRHSYAVLYLTVPFRFLFGSKPIVFFLHAFAFVGFLAVAYVILRRRGVPIRPSAAIVFLVSAHPAWSYGAFGQPYLDRWFLPLGLLYMFLLHERLTGCKPGSVALLFVSLLTMLIIERSSLMIGTSTVTALVLYRGRRGWRRSDVLLFAIAAAAILYPLVYMQLVQKNSDYTHFGDSLRQFLGNLHTKPQLMALLCKFLLINVGLFGLWSVFEWRLAVLALLTMLPNILGTIGGAEKTNWFTHYHSVYFPFLVAAVLIGLANLWRRARNSPAQWGLVALPLLLGVTLLFLDPFSGTTSFHLSNVREYAVRRAIEHQARTQSGLGLISVSNHNREVAASIPPGAEVTTTEGMMPALYGDHAIHYYPLGLDTSEYALLPYERLPDGGLRFTGAVTYLGPAEERKLNNCLNERLRGAGYTVAKLYPVVDGSSGHAVLKRGKPR